MKTILSSWAVVETSTGPHVVPGPWLANPDLDNSISQRRDLNCFTKSQALLKKVRVSWGGVLHFLYTESYLRAVTIEIIQEGKAGH